MGLTRLPDAKERFAMGQRCRKRMRRLEHKIWKAKDRREDPLALLEASAQGRIRELYGREAEDSREEDHTAGHEGAAAHRDHGGLEGDGSRQSFRRQQLGHEYASPRHVQDQISRRAVPANSLRRRIAFCVRGARVRQPQEVQGAAVPISR